MSVDLPPFPPRDEYNPGSLRVFVGPQNKIGKHVVTIRYCGVSHTDTIDVYASRDRQRIREQAVARFGIEDDPDVHGWLEEQLQAEAMRADTKSETEIARPNIQTLSEVDEESTRWFWGPSYMPEAAFTLIDSDPGEGKSTLLIDVAARYTRGDSMPPHTAPDGTYDSGSVLLLYGEDDLRRTVAPRAKAAGARMDRFHAMRTVTINGTDEQIIQLPRDIDILERIVVDKKIGLIGIDVLSCFIEAGLSMNDDAHMRKLTTPLCAMLERTRATAIVLRHLNKKENTRGMYRGGGSIGIVAASRAAFAIAGSPDDPEVKVLTSIKSNLGPRPRSLTYTIEQLGATSRIIWGGHSDLTAADVLQPSKQGGGGKVEVAKSIIADVLASGPRGSNEVEQACLDAGLSKGTYWNARRALGVKAEKTEFNGNWLLTMPGSNGAHHDEF